MTVYTQVTIQVPEWIVERAKKFYPNEDEPLAIEFYIINKLTERE
jgi:hypothetical protein